jgi:hypothetical protein
MPFRGAKTAGRVLSRRSRRAPGRGRVGRFGLARIDLAQWRVRHARAPKARGFNMLIRLRKVPETAMACKGCLLPARG